MVWRGKCRTDGGLLDTRGSCTATRIGHGRAVVTFCCLGILFLLSLGLGSNLGAAESDFRVSKREVRRAVIRAVDGQLAAFRDGNVGKAYDYAAAELRFQTSMRRFAAIVRENYPEIWKNTRAEYGLVRDDGTHATVLVVVYAGKTEATFDYVLLRERGAWRIGSVLRHEASRKQSL
jgi:hypothetical protein